MDLEGTNSTTIDMGRTIGEGYKKGGEDVRTTSKVTIFRNENGSISTAYPDISGA